MTTAVCTNLGLNDNCWELTKLRYFRDNYLVKSDIGAMQVNEYYKIAPSLVTAINEHKEPSRVYATLYWLYILPCAIAIKLGANKWTHKHYKKMLKYVKKVVQ
ncbi:CFI-box-CTERM domain-containing protein [Psychromonas sp. KJ10-10]|uniref:CFI-box-CTERM domain-containing protein n=1 Tax=Psychromonas sp. KJ10-10 TaxID=3391823 RepID=UPI0039B3A0A9